MVLLVLCCTAGSTGAISLGPSAGTVGRHDLASCSRRLTGRALSTRRLSTPLLCASDEEDRLFGLPREEVAQPLGLILFSQFVLFVGVGAVIPTIPLYGKSIGLSSAENGLILGAPALALLLGAQPSGRFADVARKPAMIIGMGVIALADLGTCFSASLLPLLLARLGLGAGRCISESGERGMLADLAGRAPELRGRALAGQQATLALGIALGAPLGGLVVEEYGARAAFLCVSAAASLCLALYTLLPETIAGGEATAAPRAAAATGQPAEAEAGPYARWAVLLEDDRWKGLALIEVGSRFGFAAKIASVPILAAAYLSGGATAAGLLVSATGLSGLLGAPLGGLLTDAKGARFVAVGSGLLSGLSLSLVPLALSAPDGLVPGGQGAGFAGLVLLWGLGASAQGPAMTALAQQLAPQGAVAEALALPRAAGDAVYIFAPFLLGTVADAAGAPPGIECAVAGGASVLGAIGLALLGGTPSTELGSSE